MVDRHENTEAFREAVPRRYRWRHVNTEALREAVPRRYGRRHVNTEALREAVPRRYRGGTTSYWKKVVLYERRDRHPFWLIKIIER